MSWRMVAIRYSQLLKKRPSRRRMTRSGREEKGMCAVSANTLTIMKANALRIGDAVVYAAAYPRTQAKLEAHGIDVHVIDVSELAKAEGAVTCCSLIFVPLAK